MSEAHNTWRETLGISEPRVEVVARSRDANDYALPIVALHERGAHIARLPSATSASRRGRAAGCGPSARATGYCPA